ncbi:MAG: hypothetical protein RIR76_1893 [Verrucomicrobiota bacterium]|jgi:hypothetical protein
MSFPRCTPILKAIALALTLSFQAMNAADSPRTYDVVVYGGTSGGVVAAVQAARLKASVLLIEPGQHLGGLTSGGLGATDFGHPDSIGGISREFYRRVKRYYAEPVVWKHEKPGDYRSHRHDPAADVMFHFEPRVAERIYREMVQEAGVEVVYGERLELRRGVEKAGTEIRSLTMESGRRFAGKVFIDATYEGDVMAKAGVSYTVGREAAATYGEPKNGNQWRHMRERPRPVGHDFFRAVDPYVRPGDPKSGTIFGVPAEGAGEVGTADGHVQAYCFRLCLTDVPENRAPWPKPADYDPARYELLLRYLNSTKPLPDWPNPRDEIEHPVLGRSLLDLPPVVIMPNRKSDSNTKGAVSFNLVGGSRDYPDGDHATRERIFREHVSWQQGLCWFVANDPRVPEKYRAPMRNWGLAKDEFTGTGHWPHQLYVREARRMVGAFVMRQQVCEGTESVADPVGCGSYTMDSHNVRRYIDEHGYVRNEGTLGMPVKTPYGISFRALTPKRNECTNLLVPVCISASHVVYGSMRMEPVFMVLGQSAATAAVQAIATRSAVQDISYPDLRAALLRDGQVLGVSTSKTDARKR